MKIPARCNRRACQARRNLSKRPEQYRHWPRCRFAGCDGRMYVDEYRLRRDEEKLRPTCRADCLPYPHRVDTPGCRERPEWEAERFARGVVSPQPTAPRGRVPVLTIDALVKSG